MINVDFNCGTKHQVKEVYMKNDFNIHNSINRSVKITLKARAAVTLAIDNNMLML